jgi:hypothetical protein
MSTPNQQTQIQLQDTHQAYLAFSDVVQALSPIASDANDYPVRIANLAMQSTAGAIFSNAVGDWVANFNQLWTVLCQITNQVEKQYTVMLATNNQNNDLAGTTTG